MHRIKTMPDRISASPDEPALPVLTERAKDFITARLARRETPERIAAGLRARFAIAIDPAEVIPYWKGEIPRAIQTEQRPDKESVQLPADQEGEPLFTRKPDGETPPVTQDVAPKVLSASARRASAQTPAAMTLDSHEISTAACEEVTQTTQTGRRQNEAALCIPADTVDEPNPTYLKHYAAMKAVADLARQRLGIPPDPADEARAEPGRDRKPPTALSDEVKAFIVRGLARYETPTRVATAVKTNFGIEIDRRQVFAYDPAGTRPPAQRWIDLHAATRAKFLAATAEIGIAQKQVRLQMLDRYANRADGNDQMERAADFLAQAAKECGGFYERYQRRKGSA